MQTIYETTGRAAEFSPLALNLYTSCNMGCVYCFNKKMPWYKPQPCRARLGILEALEAKAAKMKGDSQDILLCITTDPYPVIPKKWNVTREALLILQTYNLKVQILTKAGVRSQEDFEILKHNDWKYGVSLTCASEETRLEFEPYTAPYKERVESMVLAKQMGIQTWVSLEPVLNPHETLWIIEDLLIHNSTRPDFWKLGKWNYDKRAAGIDWKKYLGEAWRLLDEVKQKYMVKRDLLKAAGEL